MLTSLTHPPAGERVVEVMTSEGGGIGGIIQGLADDYSRPL
jgi:hypothetical protein